MQNLTLEEEKELVLQAKQDGVAFGQLFDLYYPKIFNFLLARTGHVQMSQDLAAEAFYKALTKRHLFHWRGVTFGAWLYRIAINELKMQARRKQFVSLDELQETGFDVPSGQSLTEEVLEAEQQLLVHADIARLRVAMSRLPGKYTEVLALRYFADKKIADIALILGKREGTVKSLLSRGVDKLKQEMQPVTSTRIITSKEVTSL